MDRTANIPDYPTTVISTGKTKQRTGLECVVVKNARDPQVEQHLWFGNIPSIFLHRGNYLHV